MATGNNQASGALEGIEYFNLSYSTEPASLYYLLIELQSDSLRALWYHISKNLVTGVAEYPLDSSAPNEVSELVQSHPFLATPFKETIISVAASNHILVPMSMLQGNRPKEVFELSSDIGEDETLLKTQLIGVDAQMLHTMPSKREMAIKKQFANPKIVCNVAPIIERVMLDSKSKGTKNLVVVNVRTDYMDILVLKEGILQLSNTFYQASAEDLAYYTLYAADQIGLDPEKVMLKVSGDISIDSPAYLTLSTYWKHVSTVVFSTEVEWSQETLQADPSRFSGLIDLLLCAS